MKISELAERTGARVEGLTDDIEIVGAAGLDEAGEGHVTFLANPRYTPRVNTTHASAIYLSEEAQTERQIAILRVKDPYLATHARCASSIRKLNSSRLCIRPLLSIRRRA